MTTPTGEQTIIDVLLEDHHEVRQMFADIDRLTGTDPERAKTVAQQVVMELVRHSVAEEMYLYPTVKQRVPGGEQLAEHEISEHAEAERTMKQLERLQPGDREFRPTFERLVDEITHHLQEEEGELFPKLAERVSRSELVALGAKAQQAKKIAPTRPHPAAPDRPPLNKLMAPGAGLVDRVRDALTHRGRE